MDLPMEIPVDLFPEVSLDHLVWLDQGVALRLFWSAFLTDLKCFVMSRSGEERPCNIHIPSGIWD